MVLTELDKSRLEKAIDKVLVTCPEDKQHAELLKGLVNRADLVAPDRIDSSIVTMNSRVCLEDMESKEEMTVTVVYPEHSVPGNGMISVLAPIGTAVLGSRLGDVIVSRAPGGVRRLKVTKIVYQPEASGDYTL